MGRIEGHVAVVTGGANGIGRAIALRLAEEGARVALGDIDETGLARTAEAITAAGGQVTTLVGDVTEEAPAEALIAAAVDRFGRLDILVNNAAEQHPQGQPSPDPRDVAPERREQTLRTNLLDMFYLTAAAMPHLRAGGAIINTTAVTAWRDSAYLIDDDATTVAIVSFTRSLAEALIEHGIRANAVTPGPAGAPPIRAGFRSGSRWGFAPAFEEIAPGYVSLAAENDLFMTGQVVHAKAGETVA